MWLAEGGVMAGRQEALSHSRGAIGKTTEFRVKATGEVTAYSTEGT